MPLVLGGYYLAANDTEDLIVRPLSGLHDATPNANAVMVSNLTARSLWTGDVCYAKRAETILSAFAPSIAGNPVGHSGLLGAALDSRAAASAVFVVPKGGDAAPMHVALRKISLPNAVIQEVDDGEALLSSSPAHGKTAVDDKTAADGTVTAYVCIGPECLLPVTEPSKLIETIETSRKNARRVTRA